MADDCAPKPVGVTACGPAHAAVLSALHGLCFDPGWSLGAITDLLAMPGAIAVIATGTGSSDEPVGFALARAAGVEAELITICVRPEKRGRGHARQLFGAIVADLRTRGVQEMFLDVAQDNVSARRFYESSGCDEVGRRPKYYKRATGGRVDAVLMRRRLTVR